MPTQNWFCDLCSVLPFLFCVVSPARVVAMRFDAKDARKTASQNLQTGSRILGDSPPQNDIPQSTEATKGAMTRSMKGNAYWYSLSKLSASTVARNGHPPP